jgi:hypothetical protein
MDGWTMAGFVDLPQSCPMGLIGELMATVRCDSCEQDGSGSARQLRQDGWWIVSFDYGIHLCPRCAHPDDKRYEPFTRLLSRIPE